MTHDPAGVTHSDPSPSSTGPDPAGAGYPYKIAVLCDLRNSDGRMLLLHRIKPPNADLYSPIGGKLDLHTGESPARCAQREIHEEARLDVPIDRLRLVGMISERGYWDGKSGERTNWLLFYYRVEGAVDFETFEMDEGRLEWVDPARVPDLPLPATDRAIIYPLVRAHEEPGGFFAVHVDCTGDAMRWEVEQSIGSDGSAPMAGEVAADRG